MSSSRCYFCDGQGRKTETWSDTECSGTRYLFCHACTGTGDGFTMNPEFLKSDDPYRCLRCSGKGRRYKFFKCKICYGLGKTSEYNPYCVEGVKGFQTQKEAIDWYKYCNLNWKETTSDGKYFL